MSTIQLVIIKGNTLYRQECPWKTAIKFVESSEETQVRFLRLVRSKSYLDAGYLLVDLDNHIAVNQQKTFALSTLKPEKSRELKSWNVIEVI